MSKQSEKEKVEKERSVAMVPGIKNLVADMFSEIAKKTALLACPSGWLHVCFPLFNRMNDAIAFYVKFDGDNVMFSDDGDAVDIFALGGKSLKNAEAVARTHGIEIANNGELTLTAAKSEASSAMGPSSSLACYRLRLEAAFVGVVGGGMPSVMISDCCGLPFRNLCEMVVFFFAG